mmetsp:Transcript_38480/g.98402  ORF Transcript_38480/g.98402 Transcript_38480/m.98402 type:complete len:366 (+) Transcript_38480:735-1832(+)
MLRAREVRLEAARVHRRACHLQRDAEERALLQDDRQIGHVKVVAVGAHHQLAAAALPQTLEVRHDVRAQALVHLAQHRRGGALVLALGRLDEHAAAELHLRHARHLRHLDADVRAVGLLFPDGHGKRDGVQGTALGDRLDIVQVKAVHPLHLLLLQRRQDGGLALLRHSARQEADRVVWHHQLLHRVAVASAGADAALIRLEHVHLLVPDEPLGLSRRHDEDVALGEAEVAVLHQLRDRALHVDLPHVQHNGRVVEARVARQPLHAEAQPDHHAPEEGEAEQALARRDLVGRRLLARLPGPHVHHGAGVAVGVQRHELRAVDLEAQLPLRHHLLHVRLVRLELQAARVRKRIDVVHRGCSQLGVV